MAVIVGPPETTTAPDTIVVDTKAIDIEALTINANISKLRPTIAGVWDLSETSAAAPEKAAFFNHKNAGAESVLGDDDERTLVDPKDILPGGKYRSILKLFVEYEHLPGKAVHGTAWLIRPDLAVTAGHNVYNWQHKGGRATKIKAYAGYFGRASIDDPQYMVEFREGKRCVTTEGWLESRGNKAKDVGFIKFDPPFTDVSLVRYVDTPATGDTVLGVVGYPADLADAHTREKGSHMYEMFLHTKWNLNGQKDTMLEYHIDTEGGNSGGPVLRQSDFKAIGAHVYGGDYNTASTIGRSSNPYEDYIAAADVKAVKPGLNLIMVTPEMVEAAQSINDTTQKSSPSTDNPDAESFLGNIGKVLDVTSKFLTMFPPGLGPISSAGPLVGAIAAAALKKAQQEAGQVEGAMEEVTRSETVQEVMDRAQLADTVLIALAVQAQNIKEDVKEEGFLDDVWKSIKKDPAGTALAITSIAATATCPAVGLALTAAEIGLHFSRRQKQPTGKTESTISDSSILHSDLDKREPPGISVNTSDETAALDSEQDRGPGVDKEEGFLRDIGNLAQQVYTGTPKLAKHTLDDVMKTAGDVIQGGKVAQGQIGRYFENPADYRTPIKTVYGEFQQIGVRTFIRMAGPLAQKPESSEESAFDDGPEGLAKQMEAAIQAIANAFVLRALYADLALEALEAQTINQPKEEGRLKYAEMIKDAIKHVQGKGEGFLDDAIESEHSNGQKFVPLYRTSYSGFFEKIKNKLR